MFETIVAGVLAEPIKSLLGSSGVLGVVMLVVRWWRARPRVVTRYLSETFDLKTEPTVVVVIQVELENHGRESTSLKSSVRLRCRSSNGGAESYTFVIQELDRTLPPVTPKVFTLEAVIPASYILSHFRVFTFAFSRGRAVRMRVLNASGKSTGALNFAALECLFRLFGVLPHVRG